MDRGRDSARRGARHPAAAADPLGAEADAARGGVPFLHISSPRPRPPASTTWCSPRPTAPRSSSALRRRLGPRAGARVRHRVRAARHRRRHPQRGRSLRGEPDDPVVIFNGDVLSGVDLRRPARHAPAALGGDPAPHRGRGPARLRLRPDRRDGPGHAFLEKTPDPPTEPDQRRLLRLRPSVIDAIPAGRPVSVERETFPGLLAAGASSSGTSTRRYWLDLGTPAAFVLARPTWCADARSCALPGPVGEALVLPGAVVAAAVAHGGTTIGRERRSGRGPRCSPAWCSSAPGIEAGAGCAGVIGGGAVIGAGPS